MPRVRCIENHPRLTYGRIYDVIETITETNEQFHRIINDLGEIEGFFIHRFEEIEEVVPVLAHYTNTNQVSVGTRVRVRRNLRHIFENEAYSNPGYVDDMERYEGRTITISYIVDEYWLQFEEDENAWEWCIEAFEPIIEEAQETVEIPFTLGQIIRIKDVPEYRGYSNQIAYITKIGANSVITNLTSWTSFAFENIEAVTEEEIMNAEMEELVPILHYEQIIIEEQTVRKGMRIKLPTRKSTYGNLADDIVILKALESNKDYLDVNTVNSAGNLSAQHERQTCNYTTSDVEVLNTNFVQGEIESGHRIKDKNGRTHTYEAYDENNANHILICNNDKYIDFIDSTGWFVRKWHELVRKPRGTIECTEYMAMTSEDYAAYKAETKARIDYLKALIQNNEIDKRNNIKRDNMRKYPEVKRYVERFIADERRKEEERRRKEENEDKLREINALGIWKHHDKSWI